MVNDDPSVESAQHVPPVESAQHIPPAMAVPPVLPQDAATHILGTAEDDYVQMRAAAKRLFGLAACSGPPARATACAEAVIESAAAVDPDDRAAVKAALARFAERVEILTRTAH